MTRPVPVNGGANRTPSTIATTSAASVAVKSNTRMQPKLNTAVERVDLFNLHPMVAINLHCIPTFVEMQPK